VQNSGPYKSKQQGNGSGYDRQGGGRDRRPRTFDNGAKTTDNGKRERNERNAADNDARSWNGGNKSGPWQRRQKRCRRCGSLEHNVNSCETSPSVKCFHCGYSGHLGSACLKFQSGNVKAESGRFTWLDSAPRKRDIVGNRESVPPEMRWKSTRTLVDKRQKHRGSRSRRLPKHGDRRDSREAHPNPSVGNTSQFPECRRERQAIHRKPDLRISGNSVGSSPSTFNERKADAYIPKRRRQNLPHTQTHGQADPTRQTGGSR
ncbi:---NA---, partial [Paramuricea clavata]